MAPISSRAGGSLDLLAAPHHRNRGDVETLRELPAALGEYSVASTDGAPASK